ncbi:TPR repeat-containing protein YfgC precursor [Pseudoruegeria aquimaris]|uniref:TPR repeat-containing protein YfgC n=1 Tax=Pseudoruegeria aquimaris TaxID=393663 RepID=A0A1Y5TEE8_9RHOB|nr:M48 family metallopeptidase [Pseudoruegeria aquimaris]SLN60086.1 TPR repeat-containing protein YfgC precursor [Pseudoruegeria aquimaris]
MGVRIHVGAAPEPFRGSARYVDAARASVLPVDLVIDDTAAPDLLRIIAADTGAPPAAGAAAEGEALAERANEGAAASEARQEEQQDARQEGGQETVAPDAPLPPAPGNALAEWPLASIRRLRDQADPSMLALKPEGPDRLERLYIDDAETMRRLLVRCPAPERAERPARRGRILLWAIAAVASVALILFVLVPSMADRLATLLPPEGERALGDATLEQIRDALSDDPLAPVAFCSTPEGDAALRALAERLTDGLALDQPLRLHVLDDPMVNAFALPGGIVVFFRGMIDAAEDPGEIAAVMAHELGHVISRDPARHALRSAGSIGVLGLLLGDFAGGAVVLLLAEQLISATYSQEAERAADAFGLARMEAAGLDTEQMARMFERLQAEEAEMAGSDGAEGADGAGQRGAGILRYFLSHPQTAERIASVRAATAQSGGAAVPALEPAQWQALKSICGPSGAETGAVTGADQEKG